MFSYKEWYEKNREKQLLWQKNYYEENKEHVLEMHKAWAQKNVDQGGSVWRKYGRRRRIKNPNIDKEYRLRKKARLMNKALPKSSKNYRCDFFYWGPLLSKLQLPPETLKECIKLCSKKNSSFSDNLAGVIEHQHYVTPQDYYKIIEPYLPLFRESYKKFYGIPLNDQGSRGLLRIQSAWVNFMVAGEFNPPHIHTNCDFSSVLFLQVPEKLKEEHQKFKGSGWGPGSLSFTYGESQSYTLADRGFFPAEGDLFIFPATLTHFVAPFMSKGERITISANFRIVG